MLWFIGCYSSIPSRIVQHVSHTKSPLSSRSSPFRLKQIYEFLKEDCKKVSREE
jgi:hypothetical protein